MAVEFGKYELLQKIGSGGMGQVFLARTVGQQDFEKLLVIKRLLPHLSEDEEFLSMFLDEARIAARLNHPNLIQIFELGEYAGSHYLTMEYVAGEDLRRIERYLRVQGKPPPPLGFACRVIADAAAGLDYAHKARDAQGRPLNLVHRDVSPQNILVGFDGAVKLIDFGVAKAAGKVQSTAAGILKGKYPYMSPEQALGNDVDARSDLFALGIVFWELLTGKRLFKAENELSTLRLVAACQVPPPSKLGAPAVADALVMKALAKEPADRYPDAAAFRLAVEDFILEERLQASGAHLAAFMHGLYKERIAHLADPAALDQLNGPLDAEPVSSASYRTGDPMDPPKEPSQPSVSRSQGGSTPRSQSRSAPRTSSKARTPPPVEPRAPDDTQAVTAAASPDAIVRRKLAPWLSIGALLGLAAVMSVVVFTSPKPAPVTPPPPEPAPAKVEAVTPAPVPERPEPPAAQPEPKPAEAVVLRLDSEPPGATVRIGDEELGSTPLEYRVPTGRPVVAVFSMPGFEPRQALVSAADGPIYTVQLTRKQKPKPPRSLGIKTGR